VSDAAASKQLSRTRRLIGRRMQESLAAQPQVTLMRAVDATGLVNARQAWSPPPPPSFQAFVIRALSLALAEHPTFNGFIENDSLQIVKPVNVGVAVDTAEGLMVPVVRSAETLELQDIDAEISRLSGLARGRALTVSDVIDASITISNLGGLGVDFFTPILPSPQVAILGIGRLNNDGPTPTLGLSLTFDHRANDGAPAAALLDTIARYMPSKAST
jgi:pyruvate dehydrogenase E2 component (dihydrolipoamide acetyltransferase)